MPKVTSYLARFWGRDQDRVLERLYVPRQAGGLLDDPQPLVEASADLAPRLVRKAYSLHSILAQSALAHHVGRATGAAGPAQGGPADDRRTALTLRSSIMGLLIETNDLDLAGKYERMVDGSPVLTLVEQWALPTYARDARPNPDFALPSSLLLRNTASEVIQETGTYSDAYVHYLLATYLPLALQKDPTFGLALDDLTNAIRQRLATTTEPQLRALCEKALRDLGASRD